MDKNKKRIAIIGAGISGLSTAHCLKDHYDITVFEKENEPGGLIRCRRVNGSLFHTCGGHVFNSKRQDVLDWFWSKFIREEEFSMTKRNSVVYVNSIKKIPYPIENHIYQFDSETQKKFISDLLDIYKNGNNKPQNFEEFLKGRFGKTLYELYFKPYNEKIWRRDLKKVPLSWLEGKLPMPTVPEMLFNNINQIKEESFVHSTFWYEKNNGSQYIADKLSIGFNICYNMNVNKMKYDGNKWTICNDLFDKVIFCGNIKDMISIIDGIDISIYKSAISNLDYHGTTAVFCEIDKNPNSWIYLPSSRYESHRIICTGNFSALNNSNLIPQNRITSTIEFTDNIGKDEILKNLERMPLHPKYIDHKYNKYTYPIQDSNTRFLITKLKEKLALNNLYITGRFADWEYYNMDTAIGSAIDLCKTIIK